MASTRFSGPIIIGSIAATASIVTSAITSSLFVGGDVVTPSTLNAAPSLVYDTGSYLTYQEAKLTSSGSVGNHYSARILNQYTGSGVIQRIQVECRRVRQSINYDIGTTAFNNMSGQNLVNNRAIGTGGLIQGMTGVILWPISGYVSLTGSTGSNIFRQLPDCRLKVWSNEFNNG